MKATLRKPAPKAPEKIHSCKNHVDFVPQMLGGRDGLQKILEIFYAEVIFFAWI